MSKHKILRRVLYAALVVSVVLFGGAALVLRSRGFRSYALGKIIQAAQENTGTRISATNMDLTWYPLGVEFDGISAQSRNDVSKAPLFTAARVRVSLRLLPLLHRRAEIDKVDIEQPAIYVRTEPDGRTNLPDIPGNQSSSSSFETQVALLIVRNGLIHYDDRQIPLSAELRNFRSQVVLDRAAASYKGQIAYDAGRIATPGVRTFEHSAELHFVADAAHCLIEKLDLTTLHSHLQARGDLTAYKNPIFTGDYQAAIRAEDLRWITENASLPSGELLLHGGVIYRSEQGRTLLEQTYLDGHLESGTLLIPTNQSKVTLKAVRAAYRLERGELHVDGIWAEAFGGHITSDSDVINLRTNAGQIRLSIRGAAIQQASDGLGTNPSQRIKVAGLADLDIAASWKNHIRDATVQARGVIRRPAGFVAVKDVIPLEGNVRVDYDAARDRASFGPTTLRANATQLSIVGVLSSESALNLHLATTDLHELSALISSLTPSDGSNGLAAYDLHGAAEFTGKMSGTVKNPHLEGQLAATSLEVECTKWRTLQARVALDSHSFKLDDGSLSGEARERINFSASARLANWSLDPAAPLSLRTRVQNVSMAEIQRIGNTSYPVAGLLNGDLSLNGSGREPVGRGHVELVHAVAWDEVLNAVNLDFNADKQAIHITAQASAPAGVVTAKGSYDPKSRHYEVQLNTQNLKLEQVRALQQSQNAVAGQLTADLSGSGTLDDPELTGHAQIASLLVRGENFTGVDAQVTVKHKHADLTFRSTVEQSSLQVKGGVDLTGTYPAKLTLDTGVVPIWPLLTKFMPGRVQGASGQMELHATLDGPLKDSAKIQGHAEIPTVRLQTKSIDLSNANAITLDYKRGVLEVRNAELKGNGTDIRVNGSVPVQGTGDMDLTANGTLDLRLLQDWTDGGHSSGQVNVELQAKGKKSQPAVQGRLRIVNAVYNSDDLPIGIESLNGEVSIDGNRLQIANLSGTAGGGTFSVGGSAVYGQNSSFNLALDATSVRVRQNGIRAVVDANLALSGAITASSLGGRVTVHKLSFNQGSDLAEIAGQFSNDNVVTDTSSFANNVKLNVSVQSAEDLNLASSQLSIAGSANLNAVGTLASPIILGRVGLTSGEVFFLGKRFEIQSGTIAFANTIRTEPVVSLYVNTVVDQYTITVNLTGPLDHLKSTYTSDPSLSPADIVNLLAFGKTTADAASNASTPASLAAESAVANAAGSQVASQVQKLTGISQLTFNPLAGNNQNPGSQVAIQQRVSGNILLTFSTDVTSAQNQSIQVQYQVKRNVTVSVLRDENGGYGLDVRYHKAF
jgi:translocation and assembly module TamB